MSGTREPGDAGPDRRVVAEIAARVAAQADELAVRIAAAYADDIGDYARVAAAERTEFVRSARANLDALLADLGGVAEPFDRRAFERFGRNRMRMGIPVDAVMRSFTIWGQQVWAAFRESIDPALPAESAASLAIGERIFAHVERAGASTAAGFMREAMLVWSDREVTRNALLEALLTGRADVAEVAGGGLSAARTYSAVVAMPRRDAGTARVETLVRPAVELGERLAAGAHPLVGIRESALVVLWPAEPAGGADAGDLAAALCSELAVAVGVGAARAGLDGVPASYADAAEAARIALLLDAAEPVRHDDVLLERIVLDHPLVGELVSAALGALTTYDERRGADLLRTLQAFVDASSSVTDAARAVQVHPNTVVYRLRRIAQISGHDPRRPRDLLVLSLALLARRLRASPPPQ
ncbi:PucR family transcriptional regulator [Pseudonocardia kunmingensis]|uniref:PucR-like helix-turn-helix protein n=1 Tax=Pseudonocardia kunmingensis TaxID=630975 RepID=A0A543C207_9PSEU|nr:helix-turn-helix domain-containing protein [Pseudonocardia kunmingensis]TQL91105.1 PucR-like helix-turn-helix protein [Pseudonocardia kunmingensis]